MVLEVSRLAKCKVCNNEVPHRGQSTKSFTTMNLAYHLKTPYDEEYERYNRLKVDGDEKWKKNSTSKGMQPHCRKKAELCKLWDINNPRVKKIHTKVNIMIAIDCQPVSAVDHKGSKSLIISTLEPKYLMPSRKFFSETIIPSIANRIRATIATQLKQSAEYLSFIIDCWSFRCQQ